MVGKEFLTVVKRQESAEKDEHQNRAPSFHVRSNALDGGHENENSWRI